MAVLPRGQLQMDDNGGRRLHAKRVQLHPIQEIFDAQISSKFSSFGALKYVINPFGITSSSYRSFTPMHV